MSTKTFKVGEYGFKPKYKLIARANEVEVVSTSWTKEVASEGSVEYNSLDSLVDYLSEQSTYYFADQMVAWVKSTKEYKESATGLNTQANGVLDSWGSLR